VKNRRIAFFWIEVVYTFCSFLFIYFSLAANLHMDDGHNKLITPEFTFKINMRTTLFIAYCYLEILAIVMILVKS
jgi:hypothetical protein